MLNLITIASLIIILVAVNIERDSKIALVLLIFVLIINIIACVKIEGVEIYFGNL